MITPCVATHYIAIRKMYGLWWEVTLWDTFVDDPDGPMGGWSTLTAQSEELWKNVQKLCGWHEVRYGKRRIDIVVLPEIA